MKAPTMSRALTSLNTGELTSTFKWRCWL